MDRLQNFLDELTELTEKYQIKIGGCGCCGSPYLTDMIKDEYIENDRAKLEWDKNEGKYTF